MYLLRLCADLKILHDTANIPFRADASRLAEWSTHRADLDECEEPITHYSQYGHHNFGFTPKHSELVMAVNSLVIELKLRNTGQSERAITYDELTEIERMAVRLDECRKRVVFY